MLPQIRAWHAILIQIILKLSIEFVASFQGIKNAREQSRTEDEVLILATETESFSDAL